MAHWHPHPGGRQAASSSTGRQQQTTEGTMSDLLGGLEVGDSATLDWSSSDSETQSRSLKPKRISHGRSISNPFPSIFNTGQQSGSGLQANSQRDENTSATKMRSKSGKSSEKDARTRGKEFATGNCMTCASLVRWPHGVDVFKCTICATVNDLVPMEQSRKSRRGTSRNKGEYTEEPSRDNRANANAQPVSLLHTKKLVRQCLYSYISKMLAAKYREHKGRTGRLDQNNGRLPVEPPGAIENLHRRPGFVATDGMHNPNTGQYEFDNPPTIHLAPPPAIGKSQRSLSSTYPERPSIRDQQRPGGLPPREAPHDGRTSCDPNSIFKPLEEYVTSCFRSFDCLASSFIPYSAPKGIQAGSAQIRRKPVPVPKDIPSTAADQGGRQDMENAAARSNELDAKLLPLGDAVERGQSWTRPQREATDNAKKAYKSRQSNSIKPPQMDWKELDNWYHTITGAAQGWFTIFDEVRSTAPSSTTEQELQLLERNLLQGQIHLQWSLLKATEAFLKRPGRCIATLKDLRVLLIILENPLLHGDQRMFAGLMQPDSYHHGRRLPGKQSKDQSIETGRLSSPGPLSGQHSGIIKRVTGLISNAPDECHNHLIAWWAKYDLPRFTKLKDFFSSFLTYRMMRQRDKKFAPLTDEAVTSFLIPEMRAGGSGAYIHDEIGALSLSNSSKKSNEPGKITAYPDDWQIKASSRVLALIFAANGPAKSHHHSGEHLLPSTDFYNSMVDFADLIKDFDSWESKKGKFAFCQYPFLMSIWAKTQILEYDTRRQMQTKARDAFLDSIMSHKDVKQYLSLTIRRECLVEDSLKAVSEVIGSGTDDIKKGLRIKFSGEEGIDGGGLRKEWFLLVIRDVFNPDHGMFLYDEDSQFCYFNPNSFEASDQYYLVGVVMGLAIYNSTILDVALPPFAFKKLLASAPSHASGSSAHPRPTLRYTLSDLAEYRPRLARGLQQLLEYDGDVELTFSLDFVVESERYGTSTPVSLCEGGERRPVTNSNRREYVDLYVRYVLDTSVKRQFEPFRRGFYTVCGGNAFSLFRPEEIELIIRGSDEPLDIDSLRAVAEYHNWNNPQPDGAEPVVTWFWETFLEATPSDQRRLLLFITGSDRIPATGAASLGIKISCLGEDCGRYPVARTCFNQLSLWRYRTKQKLEYVLWRAARESEGFGLK